MEGLGWWIYLCSVAGGILTVSLIFSIVFLAAFLITSVAYYNDECELRTAKKWRKYTGIIGIISVVFAILVPSRSTCYQAELQEWLRNEHGVSVLVYLDETLSYMWTITCLHPRASIMEYHQSNEVWCGHYEDCLEAGLQAALKLL